MSSRCLCRTYERARLRLRRRATRLHAVRLAGGDVTLAYRLHVEAYRLCHALWLRRYPAQAAREEAQGRQLALAEVTDGR